MGSWPESLSAGFGPRACGPSGCVCASAEPDVGHAVVRSPTLPSVWARELKQPHRPREGGLGGALKAACAHDLLQPQLRESASRRRNASDLVRAARKSLERRTFAWMRSLHTIPDLAMMLRGFARTSLLTLLVPRCASCSQVVRRSDGQVGPRRASAAARSCFGPLQPRGSMRACAAGLWAVPCDGPAGLSAAARVMPRAALCTAVAFICTSVRMHRGRRHESERNGT